MAIKIDDLVLCTVTKIEGTTVFLNIDEEEIKGSMVFSEIAAGRIRNIREYAVPNKKIVCKVLKIYQDHVELSFRRVTGTERDMIMSKYKQEQQFKTMLKQIVKSPEESLKKIKSELSVSEFLEKIKESPKIISDFFNKEESERLTKILSEKEGKEKEAKSIFTIKSDSPSGISEIKELLKTKEANISYLGSSQFSITTKAKDFKEANLKLQAIIKDVEVKAKSKKCFFELKEK